MIEVNILIAFSFEALGSRAWEKTLVTLKSFTGQAFWNI